MISEPIGLAKRRVRLRRRHPVHGQTLYRHHHRMRYTAV